MVKRGFRVADLAEVEPSHDIQGALKLNLTTKITCVCHSNFRRRKPEKGMA